MSIFWRIIKWVAAIWLLLVAIGFFSAAFAQALPATVFQQTIVGNVSTFGAATATAANASSLTFGAAANGPLYATATQAIDLGGGRTATATIKTFPDALATSKAIGRFALKVATPLVVGVALYDLAKELGFDLSLSPSGSGAVVTKPNPESCAIGASCVLYRYYDGSSGIGAASYSPSTACNSAAAAAKARLGGAFWSGTGYVTGTTCYGNKQAGGAMQLPSYSQTPVTGSPSTVGIPVPSSISELETAVRSRASNVPAGSALPRAISDATASGEPLPLPKPSQITGPSSVPMPPTVTNNPDGSTTTTTPQKNIDYGPDSVTVTDSSTSTTTDPLGNVTSTSTTTKPAELPEIKTCGYPGGPPCKIDEAGTPEAKAEEAYKQKADEYKNQVEVDRAVIQGSADKQFFTGWNVFFSAPPIAACEPIALPDYNGASMGQINPCGTADAIRQVMAWLWALGGLWLCLGWVREVV